MSHIHASLMLDYAHDATQSATPWEFWEWFDPTINAWVELASHPRWVEHATYRKKTNTIKIGNNEFPQPIRTNLKTGTVYYIPAIDETLMSSKKCEWNDTPRDRTLLTRGLIHLTHQDASKHTRAIVACTMLQN